MPGLRARKQSEELYEAIETLAALEMLRDTETSYGDMLGSVAKKLTDPSVEAMETLQAQEKLLRDNSPQSKSPKTGSPQAKSPKFKSPKAATPEVSLLQVPSPMSMAPDHSPTHTSFILDRILVNRKMTVDDLITIVELLYNG